MHEFAYEAILRHIGNLTPTASIRCVSCISLKAGVLIYIYLICRCSVREAAGQTIKSSISHTWTHDTRNDRIIATHGSYTKFFQELAGLGGDASFYKAQAEGQVSRPIVPGVVSSPVVS